MKTHTAESRQTKSPAVQAQVKTSTSEIESANRKSRNRCSGAALMKVTQIPVQETGAYPHVPSFSRSGDDRVDHRDGQITTLGYYARGFDGVSLLSGKVDRGNLQMKNANPHAIEWSQ